MAALDLGARAKLRCATPLAREQVLDLLSVPGLDGTGRPALAEDRGRPLLFPAALNRRVQDGTMRIGIEDVGDPLLQYAYLGMVKNAGGEHNTTSTDLWYRRHLHRSVRLLSEADGTVLDVGCDEPALSRTLFPPAVRYIGLDPGLGPRREWCLAAMAEFLPFKSDTLDGIAFLTSLDHVMDYHAALDEAWRVLKPGGKLYLATLIWTHHAEITRDTIHFHHFREYEIRGAMNGFATQSITRYNWKDDDHRFGIYLTAAKVART